MITCGSQVIEGSWSGGGGTTLPAVPSAVLLDAAHPNEIVGLDGVGAGTSVTVASLAQTILGPTLALRRTAATASTAMLWECNGLASPLTSTGSVACNLADAGAAAFNYTDAQSTLNGGAVNFTAAAGSEVVGGAGVYPDAATTTSCTMWAIVDIHVMPTGFSAGAIICRDYAVTGGPWANPYGTGILIRASGVVAAIGAFGGPPTYDEVASATGVVVAGKQHLVGITYDGTTLRVWADGVSVASKAVASPLTWGATGSWHLGNSGGSDLFGGTVIRAGVETTVWARADWALAYRRLTGNTSNV